MTETSLTLNTLPRFPAHISATNGLTAVIDGGVDLVIKPDYGALVPVPAVTNPAATYFMAWDRDIDYYQSISFSDFADNLADSVLAGTLLALKNVTFDADQSVYFSDANTAHAYSISSFVRGISGSADAAAFRTALSLGSNALTTLSALTLVAGDLLYAGSSNAIQSLAVGTTGQVLTIVGGSPTWSSLDLGTGIHAATAKTALDDADELAVADSAASFATKKVTFANAISSIFKTTRKIANAYFDSTFRLWDASAPTKGMSFDLTAITAGQTRPLKMADKAVDLGAIGVQHGTAVSDPNATQVTFTNIPAGVKRITALMAPLSVSASAIPRIRLGSGSIQTSGYHGGASVAGSTSISTSAAEVTDGLSLSGAAAITGYIAGSVVFERLAPGSNLWTYKAQLWTSSTNRLMYDGYVSMTGEVARLQFGTVAGTALLNGDFNISWEF